MFLASLRTIDPGGLGGREVACIALRCANPAIPLRSQGTHDDEEQHAGCCHDQKDLLAIHESQLILSRLGAFVINLSLHPL